MAEWVIILVSHSKGSEKSVSVGKKFISYNLYKFVNLISNDMYMVSKNPWHIIKFYVNCIVYHIRIWFGVKYYSRWKFLLKRIKNKHQISIIDGANVWL